jgi:hypothetical protein
MKPPTEALYIYGTLQNETCDGSTDNTVIVLLRLSSG